MSVSAHSCSASCRWVSYWPLVLWGLLVGCGSEFIGPDGIAYDTWLSNGQPGQLAGVGEEGIDQEVVGPIASWYTSTGPGGAGNGTTVAGEQTAAVVADAGEDQVTYIGAEVNLDGSGSQSGTANDLVYRWQQSSGPVVELERPDTAAPRFVAPTVTSLTELVFLLEVSDGVSMASDSVVVTVRPPGVYNDTANALHWGFNSDDSTHAVQGAIDSGAAKVVIPYVGAPWVVEPMALTSNQEIILEEGVELIAKRGSFRGKHDALMQGILVENVTIRGYGATLRMWKEDYARADYEKAEWRHCIDLQGCSNIEIYGLRLERSGGDGICVGPTWDGRHIPCQDIIIKDCVCDDNYRQGISVTGAISLLIEDCVVSNTSGTAPQAGMDLEPGSWPDPLTDIVVRNCVSEGNVGSGFTVQLSSAISASPDVSILLDGCIARDCKAPGFRAHVLGDSPSGVVELRNCVAERTSYAGGYFTWETTAPILLRLDNVKWDNVGRWTGKTPLTLELITRSSLTARGGIAFLNCSVYDDRDRNFLKVTRTGGSPGVFDVKGVIDVFNPYTPAGGWDIDGRLVGLTVNYHR